MENLDIFERHVLSGPCYEVDKRYASKKSIFRLFERKTLMQLFDSVFQNELLLCYHAISDAKSMENLSQLANVNSFWHDVINQEFQQILVILQKMLFIIFMDKMASHGSITI